VVLATEGLDAAVDFSFQLGPVARLLAEQPDAVRELVRRRIGEKFSPLLRDGRLELEGAAWLVTARLCFISRFYWFGQLTPSFFCRLDDDVVYWNTSRLSG